MQLHGRVVLDRRRRGSLPSVGLPPTPSSGLGASPTACIRQPSCTSALNVREPTEGGELALPSQAALELLAGTFPAARQKLEALGFGLVQQGGQA